MLAYDQRVTASAFEQRYGQKVDILHLNKLTLL